VLVVTQVADAGFVVDHKGVRYRDVQAVAMSEQFIENVTRFERAIFLRHFGCVCAQIQLIPYKEISK
jgi:hypothetical protein